MHTRHDGGRLPVRPSTEQRPVVGQATQCGVEGPAGYDQVAYGGGQLEICQQEPDLNACLLETVKQGCVAWWDSTVLYLTLFR